MLSRGHMHGGSKCAFLFLMLYVMEFVFALTVSGGSLL